MNMMFLKMGLSKSDLIKYKSKFDSTTLFEALRHRLELGTYTTLIGLVPENFENIEIYIYFFFKSKLTKGAER